MITLTKVNKSYSTGIFKKRVEPVLKSLDLKVGKGEIIGLVGSSGSGKSTIAKLILGIERPNSGTICFNGTDINTFTHNERRRYYALIQMVPQLPDAAFNPKLKIKTSLYEVFRFYDICAADRQDRYVLESLSQAHLLPSLLDRYPSQLSGGEIQRLAIVRALLVKPDFMILDEVTSMLDVSVQAQIIQLLRNIHQKYQTGYLFITHNIPLAKKFCHQIIEIQKTGASDH